MPRQRNSCDHGDSYPCILRPRWIFGHGQRKASAGFLLRHATCHRQLGASSARQAHVLDIQRSQLCGSRAARQSGTQCRLDNGYPQSKSAHDRQETTKHRRRHLFECYKRLQQKSSPLKRACRLHCCYCCSLGAQNPPTSNLGASSGAPSACLRHSAIAALRKPRCVPMRRAVSQASGTRNHLNPKDRLCEP